MRRFFTTFAAVAVLVLPLALVARAATPQYGQAAKKTEAQADKRYESKPTVTGTLEKFDPASKMLTVKTRKGESTYMLAADCTISEGAKTLTASDLSGLSGQLVKVYYSGAPGGKFAANKVVIESAKPEKPGTTATKHLAQSAGK